MRKFVFGPSKQIYFVTELVCSTKNLVKKWHEFNNTPQVTKVMLGL
jgi:hypothetical protein